MKTYLYCYFLFLCTSLHAMENNDNMDHLSQKKTNMILFFQNLATMQQPESLDDSQLHLHIYLNNLSTLLQEALDARIPLLQAHEQQLKKAEPSLSDEQKKYYQEELACLKKFESNIRKSEAFSDPDDDQQDFTPPSSQRTSPINIQSTRRTAPASSYLNCSYNKQSKKPRFLKRLPRPHATASAQFSLSPDQSSLAPNSPIISSQSSPLHDALFEISLDD